MKKLSVPCVFFSLCALGVACSSGSSTTTGDGSATGDGSVLIDMAAADGSGTEDMAPPDMTRPAPTEVLVLRVGTGAAALQTNVATAAFIERHALADGSLVGQALALPTAVSGKNRPLTLSGAGSSEGALTRSADGRFVLLAGYDATPGTASVVDSALRVAGRLAADGTVDTSTTVDTINGNGNFVRSAASTDGTALWLSGVVGVAYTTLGTTGSPAAKPLGSAINSRVLGFYDGQLYVSRQSDTSGGVNTVGTGAPTTANVTAKVLTGFPTTNNVHSPYGFVAFDRDTTPGIDVLYVADDRTDGNGGVQRWTLQGTSWTLGGTMQVSTNVGCRGLTGYLSGSSTVLIATTAETTAATRLVSFTDGGGAPATITAKVLATAGTNTAFRGVALPPGQ